MRTAFRLRSQGQPFKMIGAEQLTQPPQQEPPQPLYTNPNDPAAQQQRAPLQQIVTPSTLDWDLNSDKKDDDRVSLNSDNKDNRLSLAQNGKKRRKSRKLKMIPEQKKLLMKPKRIKARMQRQLQRKRQLQMQKRNVVISFLKELQIS
jgi:hypothetical protein